MELPFKDILSRAVSLADKDTGSAAPVPGDKDRLKWAVFTALGVGLFNLVWFNKYFAVCEGWFSAYTQRWISGYPPYKSTALFLPPLYPFQLVVWTKLFGPSFLGLRIMGVLAVMALTFLVFSMFRRLTSSVGAAIAAFVAMLCFESFNAFVPYDYHTFDTLYAVASVLFVIKAYEAIEEEKAPVKENLFAFLAGLSASCCLFIKHSMGVFLIPAAAALLLSACYRLPAGRRLKTVWPFVLGLAIPAAVFCVWLLNFSSPAGFYNTVIKGVSAKGSLGSILFGFLRFQLSLVFLKQTSFALLFLLALLGLTRKQKGPAEGWRTGWVAIAIGALLLLLNQLAVIWLLPVHYTIVLNNLLSSAIVPLAILGTFLALAKLPQLFRGAPDRYFFSVFSVAFLALCLMYSSAMSTMISAPGAFIGLGLLICLLYNQLSSSKWGGIALILCLFAYADSTAFRKYDQPYYWWHTGSSGIRGSLVRFDLPLLRGIYTTPETKTAIEQTTKTILQETRPGESIYAFPSVPLFYVLSDRWPKTYSLQHWYDTVSDSLVREDLAVLKAEPPKIIVLLDLPDDAIRTHEEFFRAGKPLAQREILSWISEQSEPKTGAYKAQAAYQLGDNAVLRVFKHV